jgi:hypothetical protein
MKRLKPPRQRLPHKPPLKLSQRPGQVRRGVYMFDGVISVPKSSVSNPFKRFEAGYGALAAIW